MGSMVRDYIAAAGYMSGMKDAEICGYAVSLEEPTVSSESSDAIFYVLNQYMSGMKDATICGYAVSLEGPTVSSESSDESFYVADREVPTSPQKKSTGSPTG